MKGPEEETNRDLLLLTHLRQLGSIREFCNLLLPFAEHNKLMHFTMDEDRLEPAADYVIKVMRNHYPDLKIPQHSRLRHFETGGIDRIKILSEQFEEHDDIDKRLVELVIISVMLDTGAGNTWRYNDALSKTTLSRSEGLAAASFDMYLQHMFASPEALQNMTAAKLATGLQITETNTIEGLDERVAVLQRLGKCIDLYPEFFSDAHGVCRLGNILDYWKSCLTKNVLSVILIFNSLVEAFSSVLPGHYNLTGIPLGDTWEHSLIVSPQNHGGFIPLHKLLQWLCYSLVDLLRSFGYQITNTEELTALPEYRNGGLLVDLGVLTPLKEESYKIAHHIDSEFIVEWRAMTVVLLDKLAIIIRDKLYKTAEELPMSKILQGGTWYAGREIAREKRPDGSPPFNLLDGGVLF